MRLSGSERPGEKMTALVIFLTSVYLCVQLV
jgi:hypothetical protein